MRQKPRELEHIAVALLTDDQQPLAGQAGAVPTRPIEHTMAEIRHRQAVFVIGPACRKIARQQMGQAAVIQRAGWRVADLRGVSEGKRGFFGALLIVKSFAQALPGLFQRRMAPGQGRKMPFRARAVVTQQQRDALL